MPVTITSVRPDLELAIIAMLKTVYDPEIPVDVYELGLIYNLEISAAGDVRIVMTLTTPMCPVAGSLPGEVESKIKAVPGVQSAKVELVWEPTWSRDMLTESARLALNL